MTKRAKTSLQYLTGERKFKPRPDWSMKYSCCIVCKRTKHRHKTKGLCSVCYDRINKCNKKWCQKNRKKIRISRGIRYYSNLNKYREKVKISYNKNKGNWKKHDSEYIRKGDKHVEDDIEILKKRIEKVKKRIYFLENDK